MSFDDSYNTHFVVKIEVDSSRNIMGALLDAVLSEDGSSVLSWTLPGTLDAGYSIDAVGVDHALGSGGTVFYD